MKTQKINIEEYNYNLPKIYIAQKPVYPRDHSRLMVIHKNKNRLDHRRFYEIIEYLKPGDVLVINNTKVFKARIFGKKETGANVELFLLKEIDNNIWLALTKPAKRLKKNTNIIISNETYATIKDELPDGKRIIKFKSNIKNWIEKYGNVPIPPYINNKDLTFKEYQTVYAEKTGSVAAPTAGFHFTSKLLKKLEEKFIEILKITLHVGEGTFKPITEKNIEKNSLHVEEFEITPEVAKKLNLALKEKRRIIACGTTSARTLESAYIKNEIMPIKSSTNLFIKPGYKFKVISGLITNFHLPKTSLIMLVAALIGKKRTLECYKEAINTRYRFYSLGDAMLII